MLLFGFFLFSGCRGLAEKAGDGSPSSPVASSLADKYSRVSPLEIDSELSADVLEHMVKSLDEIVPPVRIDSEKTTRDDPGPDTGNKEAYKLYLEGNLLLRGRKPDEALPAFKEALLHDPNSAILLEKAGIACYQFGQIDQGREYFRSSLNVDPARMLAHSYLADIYRHDVKVIEALVHYRKALACPQALAENPEMAIVHFKLADLLASQNYLKASLEEYAAYHRLMNRQRQFSQVNPLLQKMVRQFHTSWLTVASIQLKLGDMEASFQALKMTNPQSPGVAIGYFVSALLGQQIHRDAKYRQVMYFCRYLIANEIVPDHAVRLFYQVSKELAKTNDFERRLNHWSRPDESGWIILPPRYHAMGLSLMGRDNVAKTILLDELKQRKGSEPVYRDLAEIYGRYQQWEEMVLAYGHAVQLNWKFLEEMKHRVRNKLDQIPDPNSSHPIWQQNETLASHSESMYVLGTIAFEKGFETVAQVCFKKCLDSNLEFIPAQIAWLDLLLQQGRYHDVEKWIQTQRRRFENDNRNATSEPTDQRGDQAPWLWYAGQAAVGMNDLEQARGYFQQLVASRHDSTRIYLAIAKTYQGQGMYAERERQLLEILDGARFFKSTERQSRPADSQRDIELDLWPWRAQVDRDTVLLHLIKLYCRWNASLGKSDSLRKSTGKRAAVMVQQWLAARRGASPEEKSDNFDILISVLESLRKIRDEGHVIRSLLARLYAARQRYAEAESEIKALLVMEPDDRETLSLAAEIYERAEDYSQAAEVRLRLWDQEKDNVRFMLSALSTLRRGAQEERAWRILEENLKNEDFLDYTDIQLLYREAMALIKVTRFYEQGAEGFEYWYRHCLANHENQEDLIVAIAENLGWLWMQLDRYEQTASLFRDVYSEFRIENVNMALRLCRLWALEQNYDRAGEFCEFLKNLRPDDVNVRYQIYTMMIDAGKSESALAAAVSWVEALSSVESVTKGRKAMLLLYRQAGAYEEALRQLEKWVNNSKVNEFEFYRFDFLLLAGNDAEAETLLGKLERGKKQSVELLNAKVRLNIYRDDIPAALKAVDQFTHGADTADVYLLKSQIYDNAGRPEESLDQMNKIMDLMIAEGGNSSADFLDIHLRYCVLLEQCNRVDEAIEQLHTLLKEYPKNGVVKNNLGYVLVEKGEQIDTIETYLLGAHRTNPDSAPTLDSLGWFYYKKGEFETAYGYLRQAVIEMGREDTEVLDHLGDLVYRMGDAERAGKYWRRVADQLTQEFRSNHGLLDDKDRILNKLRQIHQGSDVDVASLFKQLDH